jgi:hypothetical protein
LLVSRGDPRDKCQTIVEFASRRSSSFGNTTHMQYLLLVYSNEKDWAEMPEAEKDQLWADCEKYGQEIIKSGHLLAGAPLEPTSTATTLRSNGGKLVITDGPFAETKEVLAGYHLVECKNLDEAIAIGARFPGLRVGSSIEVRPLMVR